jgi:hypothetical protein
MIGRPFTAEFNAISVTAAQDLLEVNAPSDASLVVTGAGISQSSDFGDAAAEGLPVRLARVGGTAGSGGAAVTATPMGVGQAAFGGTCERNNTTQVGTPVDLHSESWNVQAPWYYQPAEIQMHEVPPSGGIVLQLESAPADALTMSGWISFVEIG